MLPAYSNSILIVVGILSGVLGGMGAGSGVFIVPMLVLLLLLPVKIAVGISLVCTLMVSIVGTVVYHRQGMINYRLGTYLQLFMGVGALLGGFLIPYLQGWMITALFAVVLGYLSIAGFLTQKMDDQRIHAGKFSFYPQANLMRVFNGSYLDKAASSQVEYAVRRPVFGAAIAVLGGAIAAVLGAGSGILMIAVMNQFMNVPVKPAVATSRLIIGVTSIIAFFPYMSRVLRVSNLLWPVVVGTGIGTLIGAGLMNRCRSRWIKLLASILMGYLAVRMLFRTYHVILSQGWIITQHWLIVAQACNLCSK